MVKKIKYALLVLSAIGIIGLIVVFKATSTSCVKENVHIYIPSDSSFDVLLDSLNGKISNRFIFNIYAKRLRMDSKTHSGRYLLKKGMSVIEVARMINLRVQDPVRLVVPSVRTSARLCDEIAKYTEAGSSEYRELLNNRDFVRSLDMPCDSVFAMFIPNTYEILWDDSPEKILKRLSQESNKFWNSSRMELLKKKKLSRLQATIIASIINEETNKKDEMPLIASVYQNRLRKGIPLQACPTIKYALQDFALRRILYKHLNVKSPYNTYKNPGLPPTPICMPTISAIDAVLNSSETNYLYFCADARLNGRNVFSSSLSEHNRKAKEYQNQLNRLKIK